MDYVLLQSWNVTEDNSYITVEANAKQRYLNLADRVCSVGGIAGSWNGEHNINYNVPPHLIVTNAIMEAIELHMDAQVNNNLDQGADMFMYMEDEMVFTILDHH